MTTLLLIRHASHDLLGRVLVGREGDVPINARGQEEAALLAHCLRGIPLAVLCSSPQRRALETVEFLQRPGLASEIDSRFDEIDFGDWAGSAFAELEPVPAWVRWNRGRALARCPGGERMRDVQQRAVDGIKALSGRHPEACVAVVSHGDVLKAVLLHFLGMSLDLIHTLSVNPASVSVLALGARSQNDPAHREGWARSNGSSGSNGSLVERRRGCERAHLLLLNDNGSRVAAVLGRPLNAVEINPHAAGENPALSKKENSLEPTTGPSGAASST